MGTIPDVCLIVFVYFLTEDLSWHNRGAGALIDKSLNAITEDEAGATGDVKGATDDVPGATGDVLGATGDMFGVAGHVSVATGDVSVECNT